MRTALFRLSTPNLTPISGSGWAMKKSNGKRVQILRELDHGQDTIRYRVKGPNGIFIAYPYELSEWENK